MTRGKCAIVSPPSTQHCPSASHFRFFTLVFMFSCSGLCTFSRCYWQWTNFNESYDPSGMGVRESSSRFFFSFWVFTPSQHLKTTGGNLAICGWRGGLQRIIKYILAASYCSLRELRVLFGGPCLRPHPEHTLLLLPFLDGALNIYAGKFYKGRV